MYLISNRFVENRMEGYKAVVGPSIRFSTNRFDIRYIQMSRANTENVHQDQSYSHCLIICRKSDGGLQGCGWGICRLVNTKKNSPRENKFQQYGKRSPRPKLFTLFDNRNAILDFKETEANEVQGNSFGLGERFPYWLCSSECILYQIGL
jgi:hypothetical protein